MKKFYYLALSLCLCSMFIFAGCSSSLMTECEKHISDERQNYFWGETESFYISFSSGVRESPYVLDGKPNKMVDFGIVTIVPKKRQPTQELKYEVCVDNEKFSGDFEKSPFDGSYAGDIGHKIGDESTIVVTIDDGGEPQTATLLCQSKDFNVKSQKALEIALTQVEKEIQNSVLKKDFEIHIKIVADINQKIAEKFWLVMFLSEDGTNISVLINPTTGQCETKKL